VQNVEEEAKFNKNKIYIMFLDEINTNSNIDGLIKEIIIDRHCQGVQISPNIRIVAACNPYKFLDEKLQNSSGFTHSSQ